MLLLPGALVLYFAFNSGGFYPGPPAYVAVVLCVVLALLIFQRPLGFVAILGILSLIGMIARNAVILIEQIESERSEGRPAWDAVIEASVSRFRPIMLTAVSTVLGLIPIAATIFG